MLDLIGVCVSASAMLRNLIHGLDYKKLTNIFKNFPLKKLILRQRIFKRQGEDKISKMDKRQIQFVKAHTIECAYFRFSPTF